MACPAQCDQVVRRIASGHAAFNMMYFQHFVFCFAFAALAFMSVTKKHVFSDVPEPGLFPLLVLLALRILEAFHVGFEFLQIKRCGLNDDLVDRQYPAYIIYGFEMCVDLVLYRWSEPAFVL